LDRILGIAAGTGLFVLSVSTFYGFLRNFNTEPVVSTCFFVVTAIAANMPEVFLMRISASFAWQNPPKACQI
jgi:hypothetical protein